jgi:signal transduction histidine kinase
MQLKLRQKFFAAFFLSVFGPVVALGGLSLFYARQLRRDQTDRFALEAREAFRRRQDQTRALVRAFSQRIADSTANGIERCADTSCFEEIFEYLQLDLPGAPAARAMVVQRGHNIVYSSIPEDERVLDEAFLSLMGNSPRSGDLRRSGDYTVNAFLDGEPAFWAMVQVGKDMWVYAAIDEQRLLKSFTFLENSTGFLGKGVSSDGPLAQLTDVSKLPARGEVGLVTGENGERYLVARSASYDERELFDVDDIIWQVFLPKDMLAAVPEAQLLGPVNRLLWGTLASIVAFLAVGLAVATFLSRRMLTAVERVRYSLGAIGRGEQVELKRLSDDELGGELIDGVNSMARDLAERGRKEEFENWRRVIRVVSHEINNTLAPLRSVATTLKVELDERAQADVPLRRATALMSDRIDALDRFVRRFGDLARLPPPLLESHNLGQLVREVARIFTEDAAQRQVTLRVVADDLIAHVDPGQMERVVVNLLKNAVEASPVGGTVSVALRMKGNTITLDIEDEGHGITPEAQANLFVPSFSTKAGGAGVGLALARQIVIGHHGKLSGSNRLGGGAVFNISLPLIPSQRP